MTAYDARTAPFALGKIEELPEIQGELNESDRVLVTFTVSWYPWSETESEASLPKTPQSPKKKREDGYKNALSLNIHHVVLLEREGDNTIEGEESDTSSDNEYF